jgi:flavin reductase (DIM6/NTAB) family NADH-FMN oxidoreductase RutF
MSFVEKDIQSLTFNPFDKIGKEWMLIAAGTQSDCNAMTASWGGVGVLWSKNVVTTYVRPQRYTKEFIDANETFTISFFDEKYRDELTFCGRVSGKDNPNKMQECGLTPMRLKDTAAFEEANMIFVCRKLYEDEIKPERMLDHSLDGTNYPEKDYHTMYISEIVKVLVKE